MVMEYRIKLFMIHVGVELVSTHISRAEMNSAPTLGSPKLRS